MTRQRGSGKIKRTSIFLRLLKHSVQSYNVDDQVDAMYPHMLREENSVWFLFGREWNDSATSKQGGR